MPPSTSAPAEGFVGKAVRVVGTIVATVAAVVVTICGACRRFFQQHQDNNKLNSERSMLNFVSGCIPFL